MITRDPEAFLAIARAIEPDWSQACPKAVFLVAPDAFSVSEQSALDNRYMQLGLADSARALSQHRALHTALSDDRPALLFPGRAETPDAVFPNNVHATARVGGEGRVVIGRMFHPVRQRETERPDLRAFFTDVLGYRLHDLSVQPGVCELTGSMVIDRARGIGYCGISERCDELGAAEMAEAFGLSAMLLFDLAVGEYHANVVMSVLASRAVVLAPDGFADPLVPAAIASMYPTAIELSANGRVNYAGNCIAIDGSRTWFSERAVDSLAAGQLAALERAGFRVGGVALDEIEKAGGSLRCCVGEVY